MGVHVCSVILTGNQSVEHLVPDTGAILHRKKTILKEYYPFNPGANGSQNGNATLLTSSNTSIAGVFETVDGCKSGWQLPPGKIRQIGFLPVLQYDLLL